MVVVLVEVTNAQTPVAQAARMVVVEITGAFITLIIAETFYKHSHFIGLSLVTAVSGYMGETCE